MPKEMTHTGKVRSSRSLQKEEWQERPLRETPKFWTDGYMKWRKFDQFGEPEELPGASRKNSYRVTILDISTIRPMTVMERREPHEQKVERTKSHRKRLERDIANTQELLVLAQEDEDAATKELEAFDEKNGVEVPDVNTLLL